MNDREFRFWHRGKNKIFDVDIYWVNSEQVTVADEKDPANSHEIKDGVLLDVIPKFDIDGTPVAVGDIFYIAESGLEFEKETIGEIGYPEKWCFVANKDYPTYYEIRNGKTGELHDLDYYHCQIQEEHELQLVVDGSGVVENMFTHGGADGLFSVMGVER